MPVTVPAEAMRRFGSDCYEAMGFGPDDAALIADTLVQADLWGHTSHGVLRLFWYAARVRSGAIAMRPAISLPVDAGALAVMDGGGGMGQVVAVRAMDEAIDRARGHGIGAVAVRNSGHFGTAMYFTRKAAQAGCIGFLSTNASPAMAPWGGTEKRLGTNPFSWAAPAGRHPPMLLDMANTAVARGKLYAARERGAKIPEGWAIDAEGRATTDPAAGIAGTILPMAGHKGYGMAALMDVLSGVLSGSGFGAAITGPYVPEGRSGAGHLAMAIDIAACRPLQDFNADMEALIAELKSTPRAEGVAEIFYPGEREARSEAERLTAGIEIPDATAETLEREARALGVAFPMPGTS